MTTSDATSPVVVTLIDDGDLAVAGLRTLLEPYAGRVEFADTRSALADPGRLDVILYEPVGQSTMNRAMLRDLRAHGTARAAVLSWATPEQLPLRPASPCLSKTLTASQLVVALEKLAAERGSDAEPDQLADAFEFPFAEAEPEESATTDARSAMRFDDDLTIPLTPREQDVLSRIVGGLSNREISAELELSLNSVKTYVRSTYRKIGVVRRTQAVLWGVAHGMSDTDDDTLVAG